MKSLDFLQQVEHSRKAAVYAAAHDGKLRNFVYTEELGECRETFSRLLQGVRSGEIGVILAPDAVCLAIESSPGSMEAFIQAVKEHGVLIGDRVHDLVYDLREEEDEARFRALFSPEDYERERRAPPARQGHCAESLRRGLHRAGANWFLVTRCEGRDPDALVYGLSSGSIGQDVGDLFGLGHLRDLLDVLAPYGNAEEEGWCPLPPQRRDWLTRTRQQEDAMAAQAGAALEPHRADLPKGAHVSVILPGSGASEAGNGGKEDDETADLLHTRSV